MERYDGDRFDAMLEQARAQGTGPQRTQVLSPLSARGQAFEHDEVWPGCAGLKRLGDSGGNVALTPRYCEWRYPCSKLGAWEEIFDRPSSCLRLDVEGGEPYKRIAVTDRDDARSSLQRGHVPPPRGDLIGRHQRQTILGRE